jgi:hypothetical protein
MFGFLNKAAKFFDGYPEVQHDGKTKYVVVSSATVNYYMFGLLTVIRFGYQVYDERPTSSIDFKSLATTPLTLENMCRPLEPGTFLIGVWQGYLFSEKRAKKELQSAVDDMW